MFIKRCVFKYQARYVTWQLNFKHKNDSEEGKNDFKNAIRDIIIEQEKLELELFNGVTIPDLREKEKKGKDDSKKLPKAVLTYTNIKDIQAMFAYEADYEMLD